MWPRSHNESRQKLASGRRCPMKQETDLALRTHARSHFQVTGKCECVTMGWLSSRWMSKCEERRWQTSTFAWRVYSKASPCLLTEWVLPVQWIWIQEQKLELWTPDESPSPCSTVLMFYIINIFHWTCYYHLFAHSWNPWHRWWVRDNHSKSWFPPMKDRKHAVFPTLLINLTASSPVRCSALGGLMCGVRWLTAVYERPHYDKWKRSFRNTYYAWPTFSRLKLTASITRFSHFSDKASRAASLLCGWLVY